jgi:hypothetical protein
MVLATSPNAKTRFGIRNRPKHTKCNVFHISIWTRTNNPACTWLYLGTGAWVADKIRKESVLAERSDSGATSKFRLKKDGEESIW